MDRPTIVCPVDFSEPSGAALHYAGVLADHFGARLVVLTVDDPTIVSAAEAAGLPPLAHATEEELRRFAADTIEPASKPAMELETHISVGKPASEILRIARETHADLIVVSSRGRSGLSKRFFGSTTERVLRETTIPVLVIPGDAVRIASLSAMAGHVRHVLAPVDLTEASAHQLKVAGGIAAGLGTPLILAHVLESINVPPRVGQAMLAVHRVRRANAEAGLFRLAESSHIQPPVEPIVLNGDPAEEIAKLADTRGVGLIVMGLHSSGLLGPRMGSVTYRVLCLTRSLVLALPPVPAPTRPWTQLADAAAAR
jgi:nucleotide-binding universal stress UspA family protein